MSTIWGTPGTGITNTSTKDLTKMITKSENWNKTREKNWLNACGHCFGLFSHFRGRYVFDCYGIDKPLFFCCCWSVVHVSLVSTSTICRGTGINTRSAGAAQNRRRVDILRLYFSGVSPSKIDSIGPPTLHQRNLKTVFSLWKRIKFLRPFYAVEIRKHINYRPFWIWVWVSVFRQIPSAGRVFSKSSVFVTD